MAGWWFDKGFLGILEGQSRDVSVPKGIPKRWSKLLEVPLLGKARTDLFRKHQGVWARL